MIVAPALLLWVQSLAAQGEVQGLFTPVHELLSPPVEEFSSEVVRISHVRVDFSHLRDPATRSPHERLNLEISPELSLALVLERTTETRHGWAWLGRVANAPLSDVVLVVSDHGEGPRLTGSVTGLADRMPSGHALRISSLPHTDIHRITELDLEQLPKCGLRSPFHPIAELHAEQFPAVGRSSVQPERTDGDERSVTTVNIMVLYTPAAKDAAGGQQQIEDRIESTMLLSNTAFANSAANLELNLVHVDETDYTESDSTATDLSQLINPFSDHLSEVHALRREHSADLVALITHPDPVTVCGIATLPFQPDASNINMGFSVTNFPCLDPGLTFPHEVGHNLGAGHDWYAPGRGIYKYSRGHIRPDQGWRTIMSYANKCTDTEVGCPRIVRFANPDVAEEGVPTGIPIGSDLRCQQGDLDNPDCDADIRSTFHVMAPVVAQYVPTDTPTNVTFDQAIEFHGVVGGLSGSNVGASKETGEPDHAETTGGSSVWYRWTAEITAPMNLVIRGNDKPVAGGVYTGSSVQDLAEVVASSREDGGISLFFVAFAGQTYHIAVDGIDGENGLHGLGWYQFILWGPDNGNALFADRETIDGLEGSLPASNLGSLAEPNEPWHAGIQGQFNQPIRSVWYEWTAPEAQLMRFDTFGSTFDTRLAIYTGDELPDLVEVASNDDAIYRTESLVEFEADAGITYKIAVDGYSGEMGDFILNWRPAGLIFSDRFE